MKFLNWFGDFFRTPCPHCREKVILRHLQRVVPPGMPQQLSLFGKYFRCSGCNEFVELRWINTTRTKQLYAVWAIIGVVYLLCIYFLRHKVPDQILIAGVIPMFFFWFVLHVRAIGQGRLEKI